MLTKEDEVLKFESFKKKISQMASLPRGWDGYKAAPPNALAIGHSTSALTILHRLHILPMQVSASVENAVAFIFAPAGHYIFLEFYNDGSAGMLMDINGKQRQDHDFDPADNIALENAMAIIQAQMSS